MTATRRLAAIMFTDIKDFTKRMNARESLGMFLLEIHNRIMDGAIARHQGTLVKNIGDAYLVDFGSAVNAVEAAVDAQELFALENAKAGPDEEILVRISIHLGDVVMQGTDIFGDGVNIASRLQSLTPPGGICISREMYTHVRSKIEAECVAIGSYELKGLLEPVEVYQVLTRLAPRPVSAGATPTGPHGSSEGAVLPSIAVLPFANWGDDKDNEYFSDGITEDIITDLAKIASLRVSSRNSVFPYKGKTVEIGKVGTELGVRYVLEGSVRRSGAHLRITAQLIDAKNNGHVWAERFDRELVDVFAIQDEIAKHIAAELKIRLTVEQVLAIEKQGTKSVAAYDEYLKGLHHSRMRTKAGLDQAEEHLLAALGIDPDFAQAHSAVSWTLRFKYAFGIDRNPRVLARAKEAAERALTIDPTLPDAKLMTGLLQREGGRLAESITTLQGLVETHPSYAQGHAYLGNACRDAGLFSRALIHHARAMELEPRDFIHPYNLCEDKMGLGMSLPEIEPDIERAAALAPNHFLVLYYRAISAAGRGDVARGDELISAMMEADPLHHPPNTLRGMYLLALGRLDEAYSDFRLPAEHAPNDAQVASVCIPAFAAMRKYSDATKLIDATLKNKGPRHVAGVELRTWALSYQGLIHRMQGNPEQARESFLQARDQAASVLADFPESGFLRSMLALTLALCGDRQGAVAEIERVRREDPSNLRVAMMDAQICAAFGDNEGVLRWLQLHVSQGTYQVWRIRDDPGFYEYANDPVFLAVVVPAARGTDPIPR